MASEIFWFLPTGGDSRYLGRSEYARSPRVGIGLIRKDVDTAAFVSPEYQDLAGI
ncbi:MAG: hypothetical protein LBT81_00300 [Helicobacteraceae bacterium]|jgi:hypothetical protein|nr:hypothetical protein [Helicobacteraceae bacterium]